MTCLSTRKKSKLTKAETKRNPASLLVGLAALILGGWLVVSTLNNGDQTVFRVEGGNTFVVEVADDSEERFKGLSGRNGLAEREGMLFIFDAPGQYTFVMREMKFSLDLIWIDKNRMISEITSNVSPDTYPEESFSPSNPIKYVLEVNSGTATREGWAVGDRVEFNVD